MPDIPPDLYVRMCAALIESGYCDSTDALRALFADARLAPWRADIPEAPTARRRAVMVLDELHDRSTAKGENALALLLHTLSERFADGARRVILADLAEAWDFNGAEHRFRFLEDQCSRGRITLEQYRAELNLLRVTDAQGRLWMPQERTGQWFVHENGQWRAAQRPVLTPPPPPPPAAQPPAQTPPPPPPPVSVAPQPRPQPRPQPVQPQPQAEKGGGCGKTLLYLVLWAVIWAVIGVVVFLIWGRDEPVGMLGIGLAALFSLVVMLATLSSAWSGTVVDVRIKQVRSTDDDGYTQVDDVRFAYVRRANGKVKKMRAMPKWQVGDHLEKRRGEGQIRHYPAQ